jgi:hypothetical protein
VVCHSAATYWKNEFGVRRTWRLSNTFWTFLDSPDGVLARLEISWKKLQDGPIK